MESKGTVQGVNVAVATEFLILVLVDAVDEGGSEMVLTPPILGRLKWIRCRFPSLDHSGVIQTIRRDLSRPTA